MSSSADRWRRVEELCHAALELDMRERPAFLASSCDDDDVRRDVESLLARESRAEHLLGRPAHELIAREIAHESEQAMIGRQLGSYEIVEHLGAGGMGDVYRARDTKLGRDVAMKVLPPVFTADRERLVRFEREARILAALNHPRIGAIYGVEDSDGTPVLVLELIDGPTLTERLKSGPLPLGDALAVARQVAEALEAAHGRGIVHRDLKPQNIMLTRDGDVKVLDFGLAKAVVDDESNRDPAQSHNPTAGATLGGVPFGTAGYMSPEQAAGRPTDKRSDVWAFGCVLFETLSGRPAFDCEGRAVTGDSVVAPEPDWQSLPPATPNPVRRLLQRCLEPDPRNRIGDGGAIRILLEEVTHFSTPATSQPPVMSRRAAVLSATVLVLLGIAIGAGVIELSSHPVPPAVTKTMIATPPAAALTIDGIDPDVAVSPDGTRVVYVANGGTQLFVRSLDRLEPIALAAGQRVGDPFVSPDGRWVGFFDGLRLKKVPMTGGSASVLLESIEGSGSRGATWATDDSIVFATSSIASGLWLVSAAGGKPVQLTKPDHVHGEVQHLWPERLPGGRMVLFTISAQSGGPDASQIAVLDLRTGLRKILLRGGSRAHYVDSGHLVYSTAGTLRGVRFDINRLEVSGTGVEVVSRILTSPQGNGDFSVAGDTLVYVDAPGSGQYDVKRTITWVDRAGKEEPIGAPPLDYLYPRLSPDGSRLVLDAAGQERGLWVWDFQRATLTRLTIDSALNRVPEWTRDGRRIVYTSNRGGVDNLWWQAADGTGVPERLSTSPNVQIASGTTPDGTALIFFEPRPSTLQDVMRLALDGTGRVTPILQTPFVERNGVISPDGRWIAYEADSSGRMELYVRPFPNTSDGQWQVSTEGGTRPLWSSDGRELFYVAPTPTAPLMHVPVETAGATFHASAPSRLFEGYAAPNPSRTYDVAADGRFVMIKPPATNQDERPRLIVVQHWGSELRRLISNK